MTDIKTGDIVCRKSYGSDIFFKVKEIQCDENGKKCAILKGMSVRLVADAPLDDLVKKNAHEILEFRHDFILESARQIHLIRQKMEREKSLLFRSHGKLEQNAELIFDLPGTVVHIDGDEEYLEKCLDVYEQLEVPVKGFYIAEKDQPKQVTKILEKHTPDILVITGHDAILKETSDFKDLNNYRNSKYFVETVKAARKTELSKDDLVIFAGACQSHYEAILKAGANFASSPQRILIHAYDPVFIVAKLAYTSIKNTIDAEKLMEDTVTGPDGVGGIETRGRYRLGYPRSPY
ncbi:MAG: spore coat assemly protein [Clostridia bacterium]|nr:hypothetical protein [Clostridiales bacterium]MDK2985850.1 spore coat assemly protein [Clostridia bacterium]